MKLIKTVWRGFWLTFSFTFVLIAGIASLIGTIFDGRNDGGRPETWPL